jgi:hypothetical protein
MKGKAFQQAKPFKARTSRQPAASLTSRSSPLLRLNAAIEMTNIEA